jgi:putative peptidoglycan lipid II flippase
MSKTAKAAAWIMIATMLSKVLGFFREQIFANFYGTGAYADIFVLTLNIPGLIIAIIGSAVATTYIPLYVETREEHGQEKALKFTNNVLNLCYVLAIVIAILGLVFTEQFVTVFAAGFVGKPDKFHDAVIFTKIMISGVLFISGSKILGSYLQVNDSFTVPSLIGLPYNIIIITATVISGVTKNIYILPVGALIAMASQLFFQIPFAKKKAYKYQPYIDIKDESIQRLGILVMPMLLGVSVGQINIYVDRLLATTLLDGRLAALNYASKLNDFVLALFVTSIITVIYPKLAKLTNDDNEEGFISTIVKSSNCVILVVLPISVGFIILAEPIVRILFERGEFNATSTELTTIALQLFSLGLLACGIRDVLYRVFYSMTDTKTPMINSSIALTINIVLNLILIKPLGHAGLALSTSISSIITAGLLFFSLKKKKGHFGGSRIVKTGIKSLIASVIMGAVAWVIYKELTIVIGTGLIKEIIAVSAASITGAVLYLIMITLMKVEEVDLVFEIVNKGKNKLLRR